MGQANRVRRVFWWVLAVLPFGATLTCAAWLAMQSAFTAPFVERSAAQIQAELSRTMAREVTLDWLLPRVQEALITEDLQQLDLLLGLANDHGIVLPRPLIEDIADLDAARSGALARTRSCGACAIDITACETLAQIGSCALPFELTPAGDLNAVRRAGGAYIAGEDVDRLDLGLAIVGLGATGAVLATGGSSYTVKAGTSVLRMARRLGTLTPAFAARLGTLVGDAVRWNRMGDLVRFRATPSEMLNTAKLAELTSLGGDIRRVANKTSVAETITLLRYVETTQDAARLARVSDAMGPSTRGAFEVLGKTRVFRALVRVSDMAIAAVATLYLLTVQICLFLAQQCGNVGLRAVRRRLARA